MVGCLDRLGDRAVDATNHAAVHQVADEATHRHRHRAGEDAPGTGKVLARPMSP